MPPTTQELPNENRQGHVVINNVPLVINREAGSYEVIPAARFGPKYTIGSAKFTDFNDYESAQNIDQVLYGFGLRRYSDLPDQEQPLAIASFKESTNIDSRFGGIFLAPLQTAETLPSVAAPIVWMGQFTPSAGALSGLKQWVAVAGAKVYYRAANGTWTDSGIALGANAIQGAVGVFGGNLIFGMGAGALALYTTDLVNTANVTNATPANIYIFKFTSDHAAAYIVGGATTTTTNQVTSSTTGINAYSLTPTSTGHTGAPVTAIMPGGGIALLYVATETEFALIDSNNIYRSLIPFDRQNATNGLGAKWWLAVGGDEQRGPVAMAVPIDQDLWQYSPSIYTAGQAQNLSPWAKLGFRPPNIRGRTTAIQGTTSFLYYVISTAAPHSYVLARSAQSGYTSPLLDLGTNSSACIAMESGIFSGNPLMFAGKANNLVSWKLPTNGQCPLDDSTCTFAASGTIDFPDMDLNFPDEDKLGLYVRMTCDQITAGTTAVQVWVAKDGGSYVQLGTVTTSPLQDIRFPTNFAYKRVSLRLVLTTTDSTTTPVVLGISVRMRLNPRPYRIWHIKAHVPQGTQANEAGDTQNWATQVEQWWTDLAAATPEPFIDIWGNPWTVALMKFGEVHTPTDLHHPPEADLDFWLLEVAAAMGNAVYGNALMTYGAAWATYS